MERSGVKLGRVLIAAVLIGIIGLGYVFYEKLNEIQELRTQYQKISMQQDVVHSDIANLQALLQRKDDLGYLEYLARRELGLIFHDEEKYIIVGEFE